MACAKAPDGYVDLEVTVKLYPLTIVRAFDDLLRGHGVTSYAFLMCHWAPKRSTLL